MSIKNTYTHSLLALNDSFDVNTLASDAPFTQSKAYAQLQSVHGRDVTRVCIYKSNKVVAYFQIIQYVLFRNISYAYIPYGPVILEQELELYVYIKKVIISLNVQKKYVFTRVEFETKDETYTRDIYFKAPRKSHKGSAFQPRRDWRLAVQHNDKALLDGMHKKTRYCIHVSLKKELEVTIVTENFYIYFEDFYALMQNTAKRNGFFLHSKKYYQDIFSILPTIHNAFLVVTMCEHEVLTVNMYIPYGDSVYYIFGASSDSQKNKMPTYAGHWRGIFHVRSLGYVYYNFGGIQDPLEKDTSLQSLTAYKQKFGGEMLVHGHFFDIVTRKFWYALYLAKKYIR